MKTRFVLAACVFSLVVAASGNLRAADRVPAYRALPQPRVMYVADSPVQDRFAELLRCNAPAQVTIVPINYNDHQMFHLCDKPLEARAEETAQVAARGRQFVDDQLAHANDYDLIIAHFGTAPATPEDQKWQATVWDRLANCVAGGKNLIVIDNPWPFAGHGTAMEPLLPVKVGKQAMWTTGFGGATDHPLTRGLPLEVLGVHRYATVYEPRDATCAPLSIPEGPGREQLWYVHNGGGAGQVVQLFMVDGSKWGWSNNADYQHRESERPDDTATWIDLYRRIIYSLTFGDKAFPVLANIVTPKETTWRAGDKVVVPVDLENRSDQDQSIIVRLELSNRRCDKRVEATQQVSLKRGQRQTVEIPAVVDLPCTDGFILARATALDAAGATILSQGTRWIPFTHVIPLTMKTDRPTYLPDEPVKTRVTWEPPAVQGDARLDLYLVDRTGRIMRKSGRVVKLDASAAGSWSAELTMPDWGPEFVASYWVTAVISVGDRVVGSARAQVQLDKPWDMRQRFEWSVWTGEVRSRRDIDLYTDAGMNCLGAQGDSAAADRFGLRQYVEGIGINTFGVLIDHDNWSDVRTDMEKAIAALDSQGTDARNKSLVSLGEESGFASGWGTRYYWKEDKAPPAAQKVFDAYLSQRYGGDIAALNREWETQFASFDQIPLEKSKVQPIDGGVFVESQSWEAMSKQNPDKHFLKVDLTKIDPARKYLAASAPYFESYSFFDWYYQKYCDLATEVGRQRNPVPRTIMSAPGGFYPKVDVYNFGGLGPFYPKEGSLMGNAGAQRVYGDGPGFGLLWAHHDLRPLWSASVISSIFAGNTHIDYWVDLPLCFNPDLTHTRSSFWTKVLRKQLRPMEPVLLHKRPAYTPGLVMYTAEQPLGKGLLGDLFQAAIYCNAPVYSALEKSGYFPKIVGADDFAGTNVVVASYAQRMSVADAKKLAAFVNGGGLLITTPWIASCSPHGNLLSVYPAEETGLRELLGFKLLNTSQLVKKEDINVKMDDGEFAAPGTFAINSKGRDTVLEPSADVKVLAKYADGTPLILARKVGRGKVIHLNLVHDWDGWWYSFHEPAREAYRKLIDGIIRADGRVKPDFFLATESVEAVKDNDGWAGMVMQHKPEPGDSVAWWASQIYTDPSGTVKYLAVYADHRSPKITAKLSALPPNTRIFDAMNGGEIKRENGEARVTLRPGEGFFYAMTSAAPENLQLTSPQRVTAGELVSLHVESTKGQAGVYGVVIDVYDPSGKRSAAHSLTNVNLVDGAADVRIPTAYNETPGEYRIVATEALTRRTSEARVTLVAAPDTPTRSVLTPYTPRVGDDWPALAMNSTQFLTELRGLRSIYEGDWQGPEAKYMLSYYLHVGFRPTGRHEVLRTLQRTDWKPHLNAVADAIRAGERFYLLGEDLDVDPLTKTQIDPLAAANPQAFVDAMAKLPGATRQASDIGGYHFDVIRIGKGALITGDASVDRAAYRSVDFAAWHAQLKAALKQIDNSKG